MINFGSQVEIQHYCPKLVMSLNGTIVLIFEGLIFLFPLFMAEQMIGSFGYPITIRFGHLKILRRLKGMELSLD